MITWTTTGPTGDAHASHRVHAPGEIVVLPESLGAKVALEADEILRAGQPTAS